MARDLYAHITNTIVQELEKGVCPWVKPWTVQGADAAVTRPLRHNGVAYQGINVLMLWLEAVSQGYTSPYWLTFQQAKEMGAHVRKGETSTLVVYANTYVKKETAADGSEEERKVPFLKSYNVFNAAQVEGLPEHYYAKVAVPAAPFDRHTAAEAFFAATGAQIRHGGARAFYAPHPDLVQMPPLALFRDVAGYYGTLAHECMHWTRHPSRLDRDFGRKRWGDEGYAMEELVAEIGAAYLCADLGLAPDDHQVHSDHAAYIASWLKVLKNDSRAIFTAAGHAQRACDFLHAFSKPAQAEHCEAA